MIVGMLVGVRVGAGVSLESGLIFVGKGVAGAVTRVGVGAVLVETLNDHQFELLPLANVVPEELMALTCQKYLVPESKSRRVANVLVSVEIHAAGALQLAVVLMQYW
jgi:hypothetical protein